MTAKPAADERQLDMTTDPLARARALVDAAGAGPWAYEPSRVKNSYELFFAEEHLGYLDAEEDAALAAAAPELLAALCDRVETAERERDEAREHARLLVLQYDASRREREALAAELRRVREALARLVVAAARCHEVAWQEIAELELFLDVGELEAALDAARAALAGGEP